MHLIETGMLFNSDRAKKEAAYCLGLIEAYPEQLRRQASVRRNQNELMGLRDALSSLDHDLALAEADEQQLNDRLDKLVAAAIQLIGAAYCHAVTGLVRSRPDELERFPSRADITRSPEYLLACLRACSTFVRAHPEAYAAAGAPGSLAAELTRKADEIAAHNACLSAAKAAVDRRALKVYEARGRLYAVCALIYMAGRHEFREEAEIGDRFRFVFMRKPGGHGAQARSSIMDAPGSLRLLETMNLDC